MVGVVIAWFALDLGHGLSLEAVKAEHSRLASWRAQNPWTAALAFFAVYVVTTGLSLPGATILTLAGGALFGLVWGTVIASFAASIGATIAFLLSRFLLRDWVRSRFGARLAAIDAGVRRDGAFYLFTLRLVPAVPYFVINLAMGLTGMGVLTFYGVSQLGMLLGTAVYVNAGTQLGRIASVSDVASPALLVSLALLGIVPLLSKKALDRYRSGRIAARWKKPARFDRNLVVIGAGSAGLVSAYVASAARAKVTLVERARMGGDCLNTGCVPSKALIRAARLLADIAGAAPFGLRAARAEVDFAGVMERVRRVVHAIEPHDSIERYRALGVDVVQGEACIVTPWEVEITTADGSRRRVTTRAIVLATGASPVVPDIAGIERSGCVTSDTVWDLRALPERLLVLGGGPVGTELAQAFARLGSKVTQVEMAPRLLAREDDDVSALVERRFAAEGIDLRLSHRALRFERDGDARWLVAEHRGAEVKLVYDTVLVAVGRAARLGGFGLEALGVETRKTVATDAWLRTSVPSIYAAGDVAGPWQFTHTAAHQAWTATANALFRPFASFRLDDRVIPSATFIQPEVARVGLNVREALENEVAHEVTVFPLADLDRAIADGVDQGFVKVLTPPGKDTILGATIVGEHAGDLLAEFVLAMRHGLGLKKILATIHIYPTLSEAGRSAAGAWRRAHQPERLLAWAERFHAWRRGA